jgi:hypothetical protein
MSIHANATCPEFGEARTSTQRPAKAYTSVAYDGSGPSVGNFSG